MDSGTLSKEIESLSYRFRPIDSSLSTRLGALSDIIEQPHYDGKSKLDLYNTFNPQSVEETVYERLRQRSGLFNVIEIVRNILVLAPITLTWLGLWRASVDYARLIDTNADTITKPFLLLWEQGFPGIEASGPTFSEVAMGDFWFLLAILVFTAIAHFQKDWRESKAEQEAIELRGKLEQLLWHAHLLFVEEDHRLTPSGAAATFEDSATRLIDQLERERVRLETLANKREREFGDLAALGQSLNVSTTELQAFARDIGAIYHPLQQSITMLGTEVSKVEKQQHTLASTMDNLQRQLSKLGATHIGLGQVIGEASEELGKSSTTLASYIGGTASTFDAVRDMLYDLTVKVDSVVKNLQIAMVEAGDYSKDIASAATALGLLEHQLPKTLTTFTSQVKQISTHSGNTLTALENSSVTLEDASKLLSRSADDLSQYIITSHRNLTQADRTLVSLTDDIKEALQILGSSSQEVSNAAKSLTSLNSDLQRAYQHMPNVLQDWQNGTADSTNRLTTAVNELVRVARQGQGGTASSWSFPVLITLLVISLFSAGILVLQILI